MGCPLQLDLVAFAKGELSPSEQEAVRGHLPTCVDCQEELDAVEELLGGIAALPSVRPSDDFAARVTRALSADPGHAQLARETRRREKEDTIRRFGWWTWAGKAVGERLSSAPRWVAAAAVYLVTFGVLAWVLIPRDDKPVHITTKAPEQTTPVAPPKPDEEGTRPPTAVDTLIADGVPTWTAWRGSAAARRDIEPDAEHAIVRALHFFAKRQEADGSWDPSRFGGKPEERVACTSLVLLAMMGDVGGGMGATVQGHIAKGMAWLRAQQGNDGGFYAEGALPAQPLALLALAERLSELTASSSEAAETREALEAAAKRARATQKDDGGWGEPAETALYVVALRMGKALGVKGCAVPLTRAEGWLSTATAPDTEPEDAAAYLLSSAWLGTGPGAEVQSRREAWLVEHEPTAGARDDWTAWLGTDALRQRGGEAWATWRKALLSVLIPLQRGGVDTLGSWEAAGPRASDGGVLFSTACATLALEAPLRFPRLPTAK